VIVGVVATLISLYYYLAIIRALYMRSPMELQLAPTGGSPPREVLLGASIFVAMAVTVGSFIFVEPLIDLAREAADSLVL
jgi:NADH:ubiquinone oxidoreductase subunit 2 (subunit N)